MITIRLLRALPPNFAEFVDEIGAGLRALYGQAGEAEYREVAPSRFQATLNHLGVDLWGAFDGERAVGMLTAIERDGVGHIVFTHILQSYCGQDIESALIERGIQALKDCGVDGIISECVPFCELAEAASYAGLGFTPIERAIMRADIGTFSFEHAHKEETLLLEPEDQAEAAEVLVEAYADHSARVLHPAFHSERSALAFVSGIVAGDFGVTRPEYCRILRVDGRLAGVIFGAQAAPDVGFVLQIAVPPAFQGCGLGTVLLGDLADAFEHAGMARIALGVTMDNPARRLYERLGFTIRQRITAYTWWKCGEAAWPTLA